MKKNKGFTLIELMVVIAIIGILAAVTLAILSGSKNKGSEAKVKSQLKNTVNQAQLFTGTMGTAYISPVLTPSEIATSQAPALFKDQASGSNSLFNLMSKLPADSTLYFGSEATIHPNQGGRWFIASGTKTGAICVDYNGLLTSYSGVMPTTTALFQSAFPSANSTLYSCATSGGGSTTTYTVTPIAIASGTISPSFAQTVSSGNTTSFSLAPDSGFILKGVAGCGSGTLSGNTYTTGPITSNCTVTATFMASFTTYVVTVENSGRGSISPSGEITDVPTSGLLNFVVTPDSGYTASVSGTCGGNLRGGNYRTNPITSNCTVIATFSSGSGGAVGTGGDTEGSL